MNAPTMHAGHAANAATPAAAPAQPPPRRVGGGFLAGAGGRLLPVSVPLRWFGAGVVFHALAWLALAAGASTWPDWRGGPGWPLAALHGVTIGTLLASAIGASLQLLPVATRQAVRWPRGAVLLWWLFVPGMLTLALGMGLVRPLWMAVGAVLLLAVLGVWAVLLAINLHGARGMPGVVMHGWGSVAALVLLIASAAALVALWNGVSLPPLLGRDPQRALHAAAGVLGVMGLLLLGLSTILLPMFALATLPEERVLLRAGAAAGAGVLLMVLASFASRSSGTGLALRAAALASCAAALLLHVGTMRQLLASGLRGELGRCGRLLRIGWGAAALALLFAALALARPPATADEPWGALAVLAAVGGWLLSTLFGMLQRILPFLAAMHAARRRGRRPPTPSALTWDAALAVHEVAHIVALLLLALALITRSSAALLAAAACGLTGALAFAGFFVVLVQRLRAAMHTQSSSA